MDVISLSRGHYYQQMRESYLNIKAMYHDNMYSLYKWWQDYKQILNTLNYKTLEDYVMIKYLLI